MDITPFLTTFVAVHGRHSLVYYLALLRFYLWTLILYPLAYILNRSYILNHPSQPLPVSISPSWNTTIHSFRLTSDMHNYLMQRYPQPPHLRRWMDPHELAQQVLPQWTVSTPISLDGELNGPLLRQGMLVYQGGHAIYILEEFGRLPTREDLISTQSISVHRGNTFPLFIPVQHIDVHGLRQGVLRTPFQETTSLLQLMNAYKRVSITSSQPVPPAPLQADAV